MSGSQFAHIQTFSRKANPAGQSTSQVFKEARRHPDFSKHIDNPRPPTLLYGLSIDELEKAHDQMVQDGSEEVRTKDGQIHRRAIRKDRHTLMTAVASYPVPREVLEADPDQIAHYELWRDRTIEFFRARYGDQLKTVIEHTDEAQPHIHVYVLPDLRPDLNAIWLHPGKAARMEAEEIERAKEGATPKATMAAGMKAMKERMRAWQDEYHAEVGSPSGLTRIGPGRRRLSRLEWKVEKELAKKASIIEQGRVVAALDEQKAAFKITARSAVSQIRALEAETAERKSAVDAREVAAEVRETEVSAREKAASERERELELAKAGINDTLSAALSGRLLYGSEIFWINRPREIGEKIIARISTAIENARKILKPGLIERAVEKISESTRREGGKLDLRPLEGVDWIDPVETVSGRIQDLEDTSGSWGKRIEKALSENSRSSDRDDGPSF